MQYYYVKDRDNVTNREDVILLVSDTERLYIPNDPINRHWIEYQAWLAADPENNIPQEEGV